jgi:hypothetical protein
MHKRVVMHKVHVAHAAGEASLAVREFQVTPIGSIVGDDSPASQAMSLAATLDS